MALGQNYRSAQSLLDLSARVLDGRKPLRAAQDLPGFVRVFDAPSDQSEAAWIAQQVRWLLGQTSHTLADGDDADGPHELRGSLAPTDIGVLVRLKSLIPPIARALDRLGAPVAVPEQEAFWMEPRVEWILSAVRAFLGVAAEERTDAPTPGVDLQLPNKVLAQGPKGLASYLQDVAPFDRLFWSSRAFKELLTAYEEQSGWVGLLNWVGLQTAQELAAARCEKVRIMTMHAAKGLEFRAVFAAGLEDGLSPFAGPGLLSGKTREGERLAPADETEERRLFYVAVTRAKQALFLSHAQKRTLYGRELRLAPSRFLSRLLESPGAEITRSTLKAHTKRKEQQLRLW